MVRVRADELTDEQSAWNQISNEADAVVEYQVAADNAKDPKTKEAMLHNAKDEKEHVGLMAKVANEQNPETKEEVQKGYDEYDEFIKKSISQCMRERLSGGRTELFRKADTPDDQYFKRQFNLLNRIRAGNTDNARITGADTGYAGRPLDPEYWGNNPFGYLLARDEIYSPRKRSDSVDLADYLKNTRVSSEDPSEEEREPVDDTLADDDYYRFNENLEDGLRLPSSDINNFRLAILRKAMNEIPDGTDPKVAKQWLNNITQQMANVVFAARKDPKAIKGLNSITPTLINPAGIKWAQRYYNPDYTSPEDVNSGYAIPRATGRMNELMSNSINKINDLKLMNANNKYLLDYAKRMKLPDNIVSLIEGRTQDVGKLLKKHLAAQMWQRVLENADDEFFPTDKLDDNGNITKRGLFGQVRDAYGDEIGDEFESGKLTPERAASIEKDGTKLSDFIDSIRRPHTDRSPLYASMERGRSLNDFLDLYNFVKNPPKYSDVFGTQDTNDITSPNSQLWETLGGSGVKFSDENVNAIKEYLNSNRTSEDMTKILQALMAGSNMDLDAIDNVLNTLNNISSADETKARSFSDEAELGPDFMRLYNAKTIGEKNQKKAQAMIDFLSDPENAESIAEAGVTPENVERLKARLSAMVDTKGGAAYDGGAEADKTKTTVDSRIYTDPDYKAIQALMDKGQSIPYPEVDERLIWNEKANRAADNAMDRIDQETANVNQYDAGTNGRREAYDGYKSDMMNEARKFIDTASHDSKLANNLINYLKSIDNNLSRYGNLARALSKVREGKQYALGDVLNDPAFPGIIKEYQRSLDPNKESPDKDLFDSGDSSRRLYDKANEGLRDAMWANDLEFNGLGRSSANIADALGLYKQKGVRPEDLLDMSKVTSKDGNFTAADISAALKGGRLDESLLDETSPAYPAAMKALESINANLGMYKLFSNTPGADRFVAKYGDELAKQFKQLLDSDVIDWNVGGDPDSLIQAFEETLDQNISDSMAKQRKPNDELTPYDVDKETTSNLNKIRGLNEKNAYTKQARDMLLSILGKNATARFPRAYADSEIDKGAEYEPTTTAIDLVTSRAEGKGKGYKGADAIRWKTLPKEDMAKLVDTLKPIYDEFQSGKLTPERQKELLLQIPNLPDTIGGAATLEGWHNKAQRDSATNMGQTLFGDQFDTVKDKFDAVDVKDLPAFVNDLSAYADYIDGTNYGLPDEEKVAPNFDEIAGASTRKKKKKEAAETSLKDATKKDSGKAEGTSEQPSPEARSTENTKGSGNVTTPQTIVVPVPNTNRFAASVCKCTRVRIRGDEDDLPEETGLTEKDIKEPTPRDDANGSEVKHMGDSVIKKSTGELMKERFNRRK